MPPVPMSSHASEPRVELELRPRRVWLWFIAAVHALALAAVATLALNGLWLTALVLVVAASAAWHLKVYWRLAAPASIRHLIWFGDGRWRVSDSRGAHDGALVDYHLSRRLLILKFKRHPAVLLWGRADAADVRRLRARLKHGRIDLHAATGWRAGRANQPRFGAPP